MKVTVECRGKKRARHEKKIQNKLYPKHLFVSPKFFMRNCLEEEDEETKLKKTKLTKTPKNGIDNIECMRVFRKKANSKDFIVDVIRSLHYYLTR